MPEVKKYRVNRPSVDVWATSPEEAARHAAKLMAETMAGNYRVHDFPFPGRSWSVVLNDTTTLATVISGPPGN